MIITPQTFAVAIGALERCETIAVDTETTGLRPYHGDRLFSIICVGDQMSEAYYFNFQDYGEGVPCLGVEHLPELRRLFSQAKTWVFHNAKFDMAMIEHAVGATFQGLIYCTAVAERVINGGLLPGDFSLDKTAKRRGFKKSDAVSRYIADHGLKTKVDVPGKKTTKTLVHFDKVPFDIIAPYGAQDAQITYRIHKEQLKDIVTIDKGQETARVAKVLHNECRLLPVVYEMEREGVKLNKRFCLDAIQYHSDTMARCERVWRQKTGEPLKISGKVFSRVFAEDRERWQYTDHETKPQPSFTLDVLETFKHPLAKVVCDFKKAKADINTFYGFIYHADKNDIIHASLNQHVAKTGRFSSSDPNLQNLKKEDGEDLSKPYIVRRALVPRVEGNFLGMIDYDQVEYRLMLDYAGARGLIDKINNEGLDVHEATAAIAGISRSEAKRTNFGILYGMGDPALADNLGTTIERAREIKARIFSAAPEVKDFIETVKARAVSRGYIYNWAGRIYRFNRQTAYKAPNALIQGGAADVLKEAMIRCRNFLLDYQTKLILTIHDELVFEGPRCEVEVLRELKNIMEGVYPHRHIRLTAGVDISMKSLADKIPYDEGFNG